MSGFITERNLSEAEECFPGIRAFHAGAGRQAATFLELVWAYEAARRAAAEAARAACS